MGSEWKSLSLPGPFLLRKFGVNIHVDANALQTWLPGGTTTDSLSEAISMGFKIYFSNKYVFNAIR